jgi:hypothetical protein
MSALNHSTSERFRIEVESAYSVEEGVFVRRQ